MSAGDALERARSGDRAALEQLLARIRRPLQSAVRREIGPVMRPHADSSDILQSTYLQVLSSLPSFRGKSEGEFAAWVFRILERTVRQRWRRVLAGRRDARREEAADPGAVSAAQATPSSEVAAAEELVLVARAMARLSPDHVRILTLHMDPEQTHAQSGAVMGRSAGACRVLLARARAALVIELGKPRSDDE